MEEAAIISKYQRILEEEPNLSEAIAAIHTLIEVIQQSQAETLVGLRENLKSAIKTLTNTDNGLVTSISSGCELFLRFITLTALDHPDFKACKETMVKRGNLFLQNVATSKEKIAMNGKRFIQDGATILVHSRSRVVLKMLQEAAADRKRFTVYVTESMPDGTGKLMNQALQDLNIPTILIVDAAVSYVMEKVDMVLVGAEGVVESGGIINKIGTFGIAISAKAMNKPFYVVAESFKFARLYPLNQQDIPNQFKYKASILADSSKDLSTEHPMVDYTPPAYITLLFTDLGVLTPSAVSDELIKLYL